MTPLEEFKSGSVCARAASAETWAADEDGTITGRAVPYGQIVELQPRYYEQFVRGAFASSVKDPHRAALAFRHDEVIGKIVELEERDDGLWVRGTVNGHPDLPEARKALAMLREGLIDELSVGFVEAKGGGSCTTTAYRDGQLTTIRRANLREVSVVPWGAYGRHATVKSVREDDAADVARRARVAVEREFWSRFQVLSDQQ